MVMQMEDKRLYNDTKYSGLRPSRHVYWRTRKTVKLSILKKWITPQSFSHHKTKGRENNMLNASMKKVLWILFDQFSQCLSAQNDEYSTDHIIPNWCKFPQLSQYSYIDIMHKWNWKYLMSDILNEFQNKFQTCLCQENQLQNILSLGSLGLASGWRRGIHITRKWFGQQNPQTSFSLHILHFFSTANSTQQLLYCKHCTLCPEWALTHVRGRGV